MSTRQKQCSAGQTPSFLWNFWLRFVLFCFQLIFLSLALSSCHFIIIIIFQVPGLCFPYALAFSSVLSSTPLLLSLAPPHAVLHPHPYASDAPSLPSGFPHASLVFLSASISFSLSVRGWTGPRYEPGGKCDSLQSCCTLKENVLENKIMILLSVDENVRIYSCTASGSVFMKSFRSAIWQKNSKDFKNRHFSWPSNSTSR